jgi:hypothetical protein
MKNFRLFFTLVLCFQSIFLFGQRSDDWVKERMWGKEMAGFDNSQFPDKWKGEAAVILARDVVYEYKKQTMSNRVNNDYYFRQRVLLLDKSAVKDFSEFSFRELGYTSGSRDGIFMGIKVVKPDGTEKAINIDDAVQMQKFRDGKENRQLNSTYNKLAIDDLETGDIIDYYIVSNKASVPNSSTTFSSVFDPAFIVLSSSYPIVKGKIGFLAERNCYINVAVSNGAPEPVRNEKDGKDYYEINYGDLERINTELWTAPLKQEPTVKFQVMIVPKMALKDEKHFLGEQGIPKTSATDEDYKQLFVKLTKLDDHASRLYRVGQKFLKKKRIREDKESLVSDLYYFYRNYLHFNFYMYFYNWYPYSSQFDAFDFVQAFSENLKDQKIDHEVFLGVDLEMGSIDKALLLSELSPGIILKQNGNTLYITYPYESSVFGETEFQLEGTTIRKVPIRKDKKMISIDYDTIPLSNSSFSRLSDFVQVSFDSLKPSVLNVTHKFVANGCHKDMFEEMLITPDALFANEFALVDSLKELDYTEKMAKTETFIEIDKIKGKSAEKRKSMLTDWLKASHMISNLELDAHWLKKLGRSDADTEITFDCAFHTADLVKAGGSYLVIELGKLVGKNIDLDEKEKIRSLDVYMPCPRSYGWNIEIKIPDGYAPSGLDVFTRSVENETGGFKSSAFITDNKVVLTASKYYNSNYEPLEHWPALLQVLDAANDLVQQKLVFKKL